MNYAELRAPALRTFFKLADRWSLSDDEQMKLLGIEEISLLKAWKNGRVSGATRDTVERISYVLGIFKAINILLPNPQRADAWMRKPRQEPIFGERSALNRMCAGNIGDLYVVRQFLDAQLV
jgi:hypothetical protein